MDNALSVNPVSTSIWTVLFLLQYVQHILGKQLAHVSHYNAAATQHCSAIDVKDKIVELQCNAKCAVDSVRTTMEDPQICFQQCQASIYREPRRGFCPNKRNFTLPELSPLQQLICLDNCLYDSDCPLVQKCCDIGCGPVCVEAIDVREDALLPPIPKIIYSKLGRGNKVEIRIESSANSTYYCHVEVRYHFGVSYAERKLSPWQCQLVEKIAEISDARSKRIDISFNLKPGYWYQARVAAINAYGFRGYSEPSKVFRLTHNPKPPKSPADVQVVSALFNGHHYVVKIAWCPSKSNLPIEKYKVIWSLYVRNNDESVITNETYVKDAHYFEIKELLPESSYYIQVQAISINGSRRLKSDKCSVLYNTTQPAEPYRPLRCSHHGHELEQTIDTNSENPLSRTHERAPKPITLAVSTVHGYEVNYRFSRKFGMIVHITGFLPHKEKVYELCPKESNCEQREYSAIRVKQDAVEFSRLKFDTTYVLKAYRSNSFGESARAMNSYFSFTTPKCEAFKNRFPKETLKC
ncbi:PREDICTED: anosmin-1 [Bactrocera latifrons]|uniref:Anosmin-1 n=1 Tax=Bactrocera latifrons TaxID=174628 RepID=A0A0K8UH18_BACLA|nr:PREDICTED: anosmin-1 [Bactrocera latifrons]